MLKKRLIAVLILRNGQVVQSVRFKHTNVIHSNPVHAVETFNRWSVDEIVMLDVSRDDTSRETFPQVVASISEECFVPLSVGGWITDENYAATLLRSGADKLILNTAVADLPQLVSMLSLRYGRQCIVVSMDVKRSGSDVTVFVDRGRRDTGQDAVSWARRAYELGAGEILFNSIDHDGARKGYDIETLSAVVASVDIPVIAFGGVFQWAHLVEGIAAGADAVGAANIFHYTEHATRKAKAFMAEAGISVRREGRVLV
jgi:cyclase